MTCRRKADVGDLAIVPGNVNEAQVGPGTELAEGLRDLELKFELNSGSAGW